MERIKMVVNDGDLEISDETRVADLKNFLDEMHESYFCCIQEEDYDRNILNVWHYRDETDEEYELRLKKIENAKNIAKSLGKANRRQQYLELKKEFENE